MYFLKALSYLVRRQSSIRRLWHSQRNKTLLTANYAKRLTRHSTLHTSCHNANFHHLHWLLLTAHFTMPAQCFTFITTFFLVYLDWLSIFMKTLLKQLMFSKYVLVNHGILGQRMKEKEICGRLGIWLHNFFVWKRTTCDCQLC